jgi:hypothetical protein
VGENNCQKIYSGKLGRSLLMSGCYLEVLAISIRGEVQYYRVVDFKKGFVRVMFYNEHYPMKGENVLLDDVDWYEPINPKRFLRKSLGRLLCRHCFFLCVYAHFIIGLALIKSEKMAKWIFRKK